MSRYKYSYISWHDAIGRERYLPDYADIFFDIYHPIRVLSSVVDGSPANQAQVVSIYFKNKKVCRQVSEFLELADMFAMPSLDVTLIM